MADDTSVGDVDPAEDNEEPTTDLETDDIPEIIEVEPIDINTLYQDYQVNEVGNIMVVMYHGIEDNPPYHRTKENFLKDLTYMYEHNYRLISMTDYLHMSFDVPLGYTPIVITFDDGLKSTFSLINDGNQLVPDPNSAVGIIEAFILEHPDFGKGGCFFINDNYNNTFFGEGTLKERFTWLIDHGYDIGNHSASHSNFSTLGATGLQKEIGQVDQLLDELLPGYDMIALSYPYGARPETTLRPLVLKGTYENIDYEYLGAFGVGPTSNPNPPSYITFSPELLPRIRGSEGEVGDLWFYFDYYENHPEKRYISDGDASTIVIPDTSVDKISDAFKEAFEVITYLEPVVGSAQ